MAQNLHQQDAADSYHDTDLEKDPGYQLVTAPTKDRPNFHVISLETGNLEPNLNHEQSATTTPGSSAAFLGNNASSPRHFTPFPILHNMPYSFSQDFTDAILKEQHKLATAIYEDNMRMIERTKKKMSSPYLPVSTMEYDPFARRRVTRRFSPSTFSGMRNGIEDGFSFDFSKQMESFAATTQQERMRRTRQGW